MNDTSQSWVAVLLPLAVGEVYSYSVPEAFRSAIQFGIRVEVSLNRKRYAGIIIDTEVAPQSEIKVKPILAVLDTAAVITHHQLHFWQWISRYYCCTLGEVMNVALPSGLKLSSETSLHPGSRLEEMLYELEGDEAMVAEALLNNESLEVTSLQKILGKKTVYPVIKSLMEKEALYPEERLKEKYKAKVEDYVRISPAWLEGDPDLELALEQTKRSVKQQHLLLGYVERFPEFDWANKLDLFKNIGSDQSSCKALEKKGIFEIEKKAVSRIINYKGEIRGLPVMSAGQEEACQHIRQIFDEGKPSVLFGVTGSGKTRIYMEFMQECLAQGRQVLFLIPEIALTTQLVQRLQAVFGDDVGVYHSRLNSARRVELYASALKGKSIFVGARSSIFLPFQDLGLVIVDEEHDPSYKQSEPNPRYQGRDAALVLAKGYKANVILGSATPSIESFQNANEKKYGMVVLHERFGEASLPKIEVVDLREKYKKGLMKEMFSDTLLAAIRTSFEKGEQVLLFQNRRGYSPTLQCTLCNWHSDCPNCDVTLTTHKYFDQVQCHYCGFHAPKPKQCPQCGNTHLVELGFGTEKIAEALRNLFPEKHIQRLDYDTARTKRQYEDILSDFERGNTDVLVGTQMITKGLDFENIGLVGILLADKIMYYPDFRANERAFQLFTQVAGRAGRRKKRGKVLIQTFNPSHPVIEETLGLKYDRFYARETKEREHFLYPPFFRLIRVTLKHKDVKKLEAVALEFVKRLKGQLGNRVMGPATPGIARIRGKYIQQIMIKSEKDRTVVAKIKAWVLHTKVEMRKLPGLSGIQVIVDVDP